MNTEIFEKFLDTRDSMKEIKSEYNSKKEIVRNELEKMLPDRGEGATAGELAEQTGLDSCTVANLLQNYRRGSKLITKTYVLLNDNGRIDYEKKIVKMRNVATYRR